MELDALLLSRIQFAFTVSFHIIFPSFTIGLAAWMAVLEGCWQYTGHPLYRRLFDFWLKVFAVSFGMGVVSGFVMAFQFGTNWSELSLRAGPIQGPLLGYEALTAFALEATFLGVVFFGRARVPEWCYLVSCCMLALGTTFSAYWIMNNNSWMQVPVAYEVIDGRFVPTDWAALMFREVAWIRFLHMLLGAYLTTAFCVAATGAWYMLRDRTLVPSESMMRWGLGLAALLIGPQIYLGHLNGEYVHEHQRAKFAAIESRWETAQPAPLIVFALPDEAAERNRFAIEIPGLGSFVASGRWHSREPGLKDFPREDRPPVWIPFFGFRIMVGMGLIMAFLAWYGMYLIWRDRLEENRWFLWLTFLSFPTGFIAVLCGWFVAEVGRQPWVVYGLLRTAEAHTPTLQAAEVAGSLAVYVVVYSLIFAAGTYYIYRLLQRGLEEEVAVPSPTGASPKRPLAVPGAVASDAQPGD